MTPAGTPERRRTDGRRVGRRIAGRIGLRLGGRLVEVASAADFFDAPRDPRTAAFVRGEMIY